MPDKIAINTKPKLFNLFFLYKTKNDKAKQATTAKY